jgi:hypothetical protein
MPIRRALVLVLLAGCHREPPQGTPPPEADRIAVPGAGAPSPATAPTAVTRVANPPLLPVEGSLAIEVPELAQPAVETTARVRVTANPGYEVNEQFHYKLTLEPTPGVTLPKTVFTHAAHDAERLDGHELAIAMKLTADRPGDYTVRGKLDFAVCKVGSQCLAKTMPVAIQVAAR